MIKWKLYERTEDDLEKFIVRLGMNGIKARMKADGTVVGRLSRSNPDYADNLNWIKREAQVNNWELTMDGVVKSVTFKLAERPVNESDDDFARSNRPQIYRYYEDNETPIEEFVKHVHSAEHEIEDIFI